MESKKLSSLESVQKSTEVKRKYTYTPERNRELRKSYYDRLHEIKTYLQNGNLPSRIDNKVTRQAFKRQAVQFSFVEGQLHKNFEGRKLRVLWEHELFRVLKEVHKGWAHYPKDQRKFRTKVLQRFFFPQISEVTREFIHTCEGCQLEKAGVASRTDRDLHHTPPTGPYFRVHVDLCGPFRNQASKKRYIFVCIDAMTKFVSAKVIRDKEAATVAQAFEEEIINRHSCPFEVVTDQSTEFNKEFTERLQKAGAKHIRISPRNLKANGQVERMMKIIKSTLRIMCRKNPR
jgi:hypothetical protein